MHTNLDESARLYKRQAVFRLAENLIFYFRHCIQLLTDVVVIHRGFLVDNCHPVQLTFELFQFCRWWWLCKFNFARKIVTNEFVF